MRTRTFCTSPFSVVHCSSIGAYEDPLAVAHTCMNLDRLRADRESPGEAIRLEPPPRISVEGCADDYLQVGLAWPDGMVKVGWLELGSHCPSTVTTCP